jgi:hypothetical protein
MGKNIEQTNREYPMMKSVGKSTYFAGFHSSDFFRSIYNELNQTIDQCEQFVVDQ